MTSMTQEERWLTKYNEAMEFMDRTIGIIRVTELKII